MVPFNTPGFGQDSPFSGVPKELPPNRGGRRPVPNPGGRKNWDISNTNAKLPVDTREAPKKPKPQPRPRPGSAKEKAIAKYGRTRLTGGPALFGL